MNVTRYRNESSNVLNRQTILASINRHLCGNLAETGEVRPLGEIVPLVADEIRALSLHSGSSNTASAVVVPIEQVAAFVDGQLTSDETQNVCDAVMVDNSILAELIAAVRLTHDTTRELPPLSDALSAQLIAMSSGLPNGSGFQSGSDLQSGSTSESGTVQPSRGGDALASPVAPPRLPVRIHAASENGRVLKGGGRHRGARRIAAALVTVAATVLAVIFFASGDRDTTPEDAPLAERGSSPAAVQPDVDAGERTRDPSQQVSEPLLASGDPNSSGGHQAALEPGENESTPTAPDETVPAPGVPVGDAVVMEKAGPNVTPVSPQNPVVALDRSPPNTPSTPSPPRLAALRWTEVTGLLAQQDLTASPSLRREGSWASIPADSSGPNLAQNRRVSLRTMPLSRAQADLAGGGRIVIAADSGLQLTAGGKNASAKIDLHHGAIAIMDLPAGTVIHLTLGDRVVASLRWSEHASAVLQRAAEGFQIHINGGAIAINDQPRESESITVANDRTVRTIDRPKRLPRWVDRPVDSIGIPRTILAQFAGTDNVMRTLNQRIKEIVSAPRISSADQRTLATLASWQATMAGSQMFRLANSHIPAVRLAAVERLVNMPKTDPRFRQTWTNMERAIKNKQRVTQIRRWCEMARSGSRPNPAQVEQMVAGLSSPDVAGRATADFMLRRFYGNGPSFDATWTGANRQRAINLWRKRVGLPATRAAAADLSPNRQ